MKKLKHLLLILMIMFLSITNVSTIAADDNDQTRDDPLYSATFEFVLNSDEREDLPDEVLTLLPEKQTDLKSGDVVSVDKLENVIVDNIEYVFDGWDNDELTINDSDVAFVGTWHKELKSSDKDLAEIDNGNGSNNVDGYPVNFYFVNEGELESTINLPIEVMSLLPNTQYVSSYENVDNEVDLPRFDNTADLQFLGWTKVGKANYDNVIEFVNYFGVWGKPRESTRALPGLYPGEGGFSVYIGSVSVSGGVPIITLSDGTAAFCLQQEVRGYGVSGTGYVYTGGMDSTLANIAYNALRKDGQYAAQVAVWNQDMNYYDDDYSCDGSYYETYYDAATGMPLQNIGVPSCSLVPKEGSVKVKKVAGSSSVDYMSISPSSYSLSGAEYKVYSDSSCTNSVGTLTTGSNGESSSLNLRTGTYYVKESKASKGFKLDTTVHEAKITANNTTTITSTEQPITSKLKLTKKQATSSYDYVKNSPNNYSLAGAEYSVYTDSARTNKVGTLTTTSNGTTNTLELPIGTYYVRETKASKGFKLDTNTYTARLTTADATVTLDSTEQPLNDPVRLKLYKESAREGFDTSLLEGAEFTLRYYDAQTDNPSGNAKYTWVFKTIINSNNQAEIVFDQAHYLRGDELILNSQNMFYLPLGTFTIEETLAPNGFARDTNVYVGHITQSGENVRVDINGSDMLIVDNLDLTQNENPQYVIISVQKLDEETGLNVAQGLGTLKGAEFEVYKNVEVSEGVSEKQLVGTIVTDENGKGSLSKDTNNLELLPGKYFVKETKAPDGYELNDIEIEVDALIVERNTAVFEYTIEVRNKVSQIIVHKVDSNRDYIAEAEIQLLDENGNVVYSWITDKAPHVIKGLTLNKLYTLHEIFTLPKYALADDIEIKLVDSDPVDIEMVDGIVAIHTSAVFEETGDHNYVADGVAHIIDTVDYEWLYPDQDYKMKGQLIDLSQEVDETNEDQVTTTIKVTDEDGNTIEKTYVVICEQELEFKPKEKFGSVDMEYVVDLDGYDDHDFVVFEELYLISKDVPKTIIDEETGEETTIYEDIEEWQCEHKDENDDSQRVHVDKLYRAGMVLYKTSNINSTHRLNGAIFNITTKREKRDGTLVKKDLGTFVTGGIYYSSDKEFEVIVAEDEDMKKVVDTYESTKASEELHEIVITNLPEGIYYAQVKGSEEVTKHYVAKGMIYLEDQPENTEITYTEIKAPVGYILDKKPFVVSVGDDYSLSRIENYRQNTFYIPNTGVE